MTGPAAAQADTLLDLGTVTFAETSVRSVNWDSFVLVAEEHCSENPEGPSEKIFGFGSAMSAMAPQRVSTPGSRYG